MEKLRIKIILRRKDFCIPISYGAQLQGLIYGMFPKDDLGDFYHNGGYTLDNKTFKLFVFSNLFGQYSIKNKMMYFTDVFYFYISAQDERFLQTVYNFLMKNNYVFLHNQKVRVENIEINDLSAFAGIKPVRIKTISPITVYKKEKDFTTYYKPSDKQFLSIVYQNLKEKIEAYHYPVELYRFEIVEIHRSKERMVKFKNSYYLAFDIEMSVLVSFELLLFIYNTGISAKGSCGFGMIDVIK